MHDAENTQASLIGSLKMIRKSGFTLPVWNPRGKSL